VSKEINVKKLFMVVVACAMLLPLWSADRNEQESQRFIVESERKWAESIASGDTTQVEQFLADDFLGVDTDGTLYDKAKAISDTKHDFKDYAFNHVNEVKVRFFGDTAVAQGSESWERRTGEPKLGRFVWTDTWIRRNGRWQVIAAEDLIIPEPKK
jgi:ketosteroid isomerase-like protein